MALHLGQLKPAAGSARSKKRVGRGNASGHGSYSTRGLKGQRARSGSRKGLKLKGLKARLQTVPKLRGFKSPYPKAAVVNIASLQAMFADGAEVTPAALVKAGLINRTAVTAKILGQGALSRKLNIRGCSVSTSAKEQIEAAGGSVKA